MISIRPCVAAVVAIVPAATAAAQCTPDWQLPSGLAVDGDIHCAIQWDPDGAGPIGPHLVLGGAFTRCAGVAANRLALVDLSTRTASAFGTGANDTVRSLAIGSGNELFVGGAFTAVGGVAAAGVARYQANAWQACGTGVSIASGGPVTMVVRPNGDLVVGGRFASAGGIAVENVARWNGSAWSALGAGLHADDFVAAAGNPGGVRELLETPSGLVAVGLIDASGSTPVQTVAAWNGVSWQTAGGFAGATAVISVDGCVLPNGDLLVGGRSFFAPASFLFRWDGVAWSPVAPPANTPHLLTALANGDMIAASNIGFGQVAVHRRRGLAWQQIGSMVAAPWTAKALTVAPLPGLAADGFAVGGSQLVQMSGVLAASLLLHDDQNGWQGSDTVFAAPRPQLRTAANGDVFVFQAGSIGTTQLPGAGRWNGAGWVPVPSSPPDLSALACDPRGGLVAANANGVYRFDGVAWAQLGAAPVLSADLLAVLDDGSILAVRADSAGHRWNGSWQNLGAAPTRVAQHPDGRLIATGSPASFPFWSRVGAYAGGTWTNLDPTGSIDGPPYSLVVLQNGDIVVGGAFTFGNRVAVRSGSTWQGLGTGFDGTVEDLAVLADGTLVASGTFTAAGTVACAGIAAWNGIAWGPLPGAPTSVVSLAAHPNGDLWTITNSRELARLTSPCAATAQATPSSCVNPATAGWLAAPAWPVLGGICRSEASGLPPAAFAVGVFGQPWSPLSLASALPLASAGCDLRVQPDVLVAVVSTTGTARFQFPVPVVPALVGFGLQQQVVVLGLQAAGIVSATSTNSLALVVGSR